MPTSPKVMTGDVVKDHPIINVLSSNAKKRVSDALKPLFVQASCGYGLLPCPRDYDLWPPFGRDPLEQSDASQAEEVRFRESERLALVRDEIAAERPVAFDIVAAPAQPIIYEGREYFVVGEPSPDKLVLTSVRPDRDDAQPADEPVFEAMVPDETATGDAKKLAKADNDAPEIPANFCGGFYGPVSSSGDRSINVMLGVNAQIGAVGLGADAFFSGTYWTEYLNGSLRGGPCAPRACKTETALIASMRVGITAKIYFQANAGVVVPPFGPVGNSFGAYVGLEIETEGIVDCTIPIVV